MKIVFESERLVCRRWQPEDLPAIYAVYSDKEGARYVDDGTPITADECQAWMATTLRNYETRGYGMFTLDSRLTGETIGFMGLVHPNNQVEAEAKYAFLKSTWGQGYASEALPLLLQYGRVQHELNRIIATVAHEHVVSKRVLSKAGMTYVKTITEDDGAKTDVYEWYGDEVLQL